MQRSTITGSEFAASISSSFGEFFSSYPAALRNDFQNAALQGAAVAFTLELTEDSLKKYGCSRLQIHAVHELIQLLISIVTGSFLANSAAFLASSSLKWFGYQDHHCEAGATAAAALVQLAQNLSVLGAVRIGAQMAGGYAGSRFTLWVKEEMKSLPKTNENVLSASKSAEIDAFVQLAYM